LATVRTFGGTFKKTIPSKLFLHHHSRIVRLNPNSISPMDKSSRTRAEDHSRAAFALFELLIVLVLIALIAPFLLYSLARYRAKPTPKILCVNNLKNIGIASQIFAADHNGLYPWQTPELNRASNAVQIFLSLTNELTIPKILTCQTDSRSPATNWTNLRLTNISYFIGLDSSSNNPTSILAGDRNILVESQRATSGRIQILTNANVAWDATQHHHAGNLCMGDAHVQIQNNLRLNDTIHRLNLATNSATFLFP
jgi:type II secretory pathway pseudopilin PulG